MTAFHSLSDRTLIIIMNAIIRQAPKIAGYKNLTALRYFRRMSPRAFYLFDDRRVKKPSKSINV